MARGLLLVSVCMLGIVLPNARSWAYDREQERAIEARIDKLLAIRNKSFDDLVMLAMLNRALSLARSSMALPTMNNPRKRGIAQ